MNLKQIKKRIVYLQTELQHEGFHDGWVIEGLKGELKTLIELEKIKTRNEKNGNE